jgi:hypothetical protein
MTGVRVLPTSEVEGVELVLFLPGQSLLDYFPYLTMARLGIGWLFFLFGVVIVKKVVQAEDVHEF